MTRTPTPTSGSATSGRTLLAVSVLLAVVVVAVYWSSLGGCFILDDEASILSNPHLQGEHSLVSALRPPLQAPGAPRWRGPVIGLTLAINHRLGGLDPWGYHLLNLLAHLLAALAVLGIVRRTLQLSGLRERYGDVALGLALTSALLWAVHPLLTDSVTYVIQRTTVIMGLFYLVTLYAVIRGAIAARPGPWYVAAVITCLLGMLTKEAMVTAPVLVVLYERIFLAGSWGKVWRSRGRLHLSLASTWIALGWLVAVSPHPGVIGFDLRMGPFGYLLTQTRVIMRYLQLAVWPDGLLLDYGPAEAVSAAQAAGPGLLLLVLLVLCLVGLRSRPRLAYLGLWFFLVLAPTSSVVPIVEEVGAERRMYLPLIGLVVLAVLGGHRLLDRASNRLSLSPRTVRGVATVIVAALVVALGTATGARNTQYYDVLGMWRDAAAGQPRNPRAFNGVGVALVRAGRTTEAIAQYERAIAVSSRYVEAHYNLGCALTREGRHAEAMAQFERTVALAPDNYRAQNNLGNTCLRLGRFAEAEIHFREVLRLDPNSAFGHNGRGMALVQLDRADEAVAAFEGALRANPRHARAAFNLGNALASLGRTDEAIDAYRRALSIDPRLEEAGERLAALSGG